MFKIGDEVLCVHDTKGWANHYLTAGKVYIIKTVTNKGATLVLEEDNMRGSRGFYFYRFIPNTPEAKAEWMRKKLEGE